MTTTQEEFDPFKGETGFKDDYDGVIEDAWFGTQDNYGDTVMLHLKVVADDGDEVENRYPCGPDWATYDGGETVEHPKGERKGFSNNVRYFKLISGAMGIEGVESVLRRRSAELNGKGPKAAALWKGLKFHWNVVSEDVKFKDKETGEWIERTVSVVLPSSFLGESGNSGGANPAAPTSAASSATSAAAASAPPTATTNGLDPALKLQLQNAAKKAADYSSFCDLALEIPGVVEDQAVMGRVADEAFYAELRG